MKKILVKAVMLLLTFTFSLSTVKAQAPESFTYQAIVRDNAGQPLPNTAVTFQFNILQGSASGTTVYSEEHSATTNGFGLVNLQIGQGTVNSGTFSAIDWGNDSYFLNVQIDQGSGFVDMGTQQFISVPYAMYAKNAGTANSAGAAGNNGDVQLNDNGSMGADPDLHWDFAGKKFIVGQDTSDGRMIIQQDANASDSIPILEVKNKAGQTIFVVYPDSVHIFIDDDNTKGVLKGGFAVSGRNGTKAPVNDYLLVRPDSTRIYFNETGAKGVLKGGFAVSGRSGTKSGINEYFNISSADTTATINPSEPRVMWYPKKEAFLTGRVLIESPDSVGLNSFATGFESKAIGNYSQSMGYSAITRMDYSTSIGKNTIAGGESSFAFGDSSEALGNHSFALGYKTISTGEGAVAFGSIQVDTSGNPVLSRTMALGDFSFAAGLAAKTTVTGFGSISIGMGTETDNYASLSIGSFNKSRGIYSTTIGSGCFADSSFSAAIGFADTAIGTGAMALGFYSKATGEFAFALGDSAFATGAGASALGFNVVASGMLSTASGHYVSTNGKIGAYIYGDASTNTPTLNTLDNQFMIRASGGYVFYSDPTLNENNTVYINPLNGNMGIGISTPTQKLTIKDVMKLIPRTSAPSGATPGDIYFDATTQKLRVYTTFGWQDCN